MKRGYTKAWRKELDSEIWLMPPLYLKVWYFIRHKAQYEPHLFPTHKKIGIWVLPGQRLTSLQEIAEGVKWSEWGREIIPNKKTIKTVLDWMVDEEMVTVESNAKGTLITIVNWDTYNHVDESESNAIETRSKRASDTRKELIKNKNLSIPGDDTVEDVGSNKPLPDEAISLAEQLAKNVLVIVPTHRELSNGKRASVVARWADDIDKMQRIDGRSWVDIREMIDWCHNDDFWKRNILSGKKLREQYDKMFARKGSKPGGISDDFKRKFLGRN